MPTVEAVAGWLVIRGWSWGSEGMSFAGQDPTQQTPTRNAVEQEERIKTPTIAHRLTTLPFGAPPMTTDRPRLFVELCCGSAAVTLKLLGGRHAARLPVIY